MIVRERATDDQSGTGSSGVPSPPEADAFRRELTQRLAIPPLPIWERRSPQRRDVGPVAETNVARQIATTRPALGPGTIVLLSRSTEPASGWNRRREGHRTSRAAARALLAYPSSSCCGRRHARARVRGANFGTYFDLTCSVDGDGLVTSNYFRAARARRASSSRLSTPPYIGRQTSLRASSFRARTSAALSAPDHQRKSLRVVLQGFDPRLFRPVNSATRSAAVNPICQISATMVAASAATSPPPSLRDAAATGGTT